MQNDRWTALAAKTQQHADLGNMRSFYEALKAVYGPSHQIQALLRSADGTILLNDIEAVMLRSSEHFEGLFSDQRFNCHEVFNCQNAQVELKKDPDSLPTLAEVMKTIA